MKFNLTFQWNDLLNSTLIDDITVEPLKSVLFIEDWKLWWPQNPSLMVAPINQKSLIKFVM